MSGQDILLLLPAAKATNDASKDLTPRSQAGLTLRKNQE
jgi:hypothetical protein